MSKSILQEANDLINGQRAQDYGDVTENFQRIADLWTTYLGNVEPLTVFDVSNLMILVKVARVRSGSVGGTDFHRDSFVDIAGYAALAEKCKAAIVASQEPVEPNGAIVFRTEPLEWEPNPNDFRQAVGEPRVWDSVADVPLGVHTHDSDGDSFWGDGEGPDADLDSYAPFTEILGPPPTEGSK